MNPRTERIGLVGLLAGTLLAGWRAFPDPSAPAGQAERRQVVVRTKPPYLLPPMDGSRLEVQLVEVTYQPGGFSPPHSHPCPVVGYVVEGAVRTQVEGEVEKIHRAGESFYEAPNGVHLVSANASSTEPARFQAWFTCDRPTPLGVAVPDPHPTRARTP